MALEHMPCLKELNGQVHAHAGAGMDVMMLQTEGVI